MYLTEADICRKFVVPKLQSAGWDNDPHSIAEHGNAQFVLPDVLKVPPISDHGKPGEIIGIFGGADQLRNAVNQMQTLLYAA